MRRRSLHAGVLVIACASAAGAQPGGAGLDAAIAEAISLRERGRDGEALALLTRAWDETRSARARAQMARAEQALGRWLDARDHMTEALASRDDPWIAARVAALEDERAGMEAHLGRLEVLGVPEGAEVQLDDRPPLRAPLPGALWSAVGTVVLSVRLPGYFPVVRRVVVDAGGVARETVTLVPMQLSAASPDAPSAPPTSPPTIAPRAPAPLRLTTAMHPRRALGLAGLVLGAAFALGGAAAQVARELSLDVALAEGCARTTAGGVVGPAGCASRVVSTEVASALAIAGYVSGGALLGAGLALLLTAPRGDDARRGWSCAPGLLGGACALRF